MTLILIIIYSLNCKQGNDLDANINTLYYGSPKQFFKQSH